MPFIDLLALRQERPIRSQFAVCIQGRHLQISPAPEVIAALGWKRRDHIRILIGTEEDRGLVRLERGQGWSLQPPGSTGRTLRLRFKREIYGRPTFPETPEANGRHMVSKVEIDATGGVTFVLPWFDREVRPTVVHLEGSPTTLEDHLAAKLPGDQRVRVQVPTEPPPTAAVPHTPTVLKKVDGSAFGSMTAKQTEAFVQAAARGATAQELVTATGGTYARGSIGYLRDKLAPQIAEARKMLAGAASLDPKDWAPEVREAFILAAARGAPATELASISKLGTGQVWNVVRHHLKEEVAAAQKRLQANGAPSAWGVLTEAQWRFLREEVQPLVEGMGYKIVRKDGADGPRLFADGEELATPDQFIMLANLELAAGDKLTLPAA